MKRITTTETIKYTDKEVRLCGWVNSRRDHGKLIFIDLRDRSGLVQIVFSPDHKPKIYESAQKLRSEWVIEIIGEVKKRPKGMENPKVKTGKIEIKAADLKILAKAETPPFSIESDGYEISENKRLKYRYLDLRRRRLLKNLETRYNTLQYLRNSLGEKGFIEVETPILTKSTPEGARDFLVPSRLEPGKFYALPQSPQQYKQMLMIAGIEKYFQVAIALRDEDPRADRQAEHTQLDIEMSFISQEDILDLIEKLFINLIRKLFPEKKIQQIPFPRLEYKDSIKKYKTDKPDLRKDPEGKQASYGASKNNPDELAFAFIVNFPMFEWHPSTSSGQVPKKGKWGAMHHPFTKPQTEDIEEIKKNPKKILANQYDFVLNGCEIGGGSIRTTDLKMLSAVFEVLGHSPAETKEKFKNYFNAFQYGTPPHGGIAIGFDRFLSIILKEPNIREVIAFPKTGDNRDLMMDAPSSVSKEQLKELHLKITKEPQH